jgi:hypothetical protein
VVIRARRKGNKLLPALTSGYLVMRIPINGTGPQMGQPSNVGTGVLARAGAERFMLTQFSRLAMIVLVKVAH